MARAVVAHWIDRYANMNYIFMLGAMISIFAVAPFAGFSRWINALLNLSILLVMASALVACVKKPRLFYAAAGLWLIAQAFSYTGIIGDMASAYATGNGLRFVFLSVVIGVIFANVLRSDAVTLNTIFGASCIYMLMGLAWASIFSLLDWAFPGSFTVPHDAASWTDRFGPMPRQAQLIYFSMITLTTVGYGDIAPLSSAARFLAVIEAIIGQLFLVTIIARLVSLDIASRIRNRN